VIHAAHAILRKLWQGCHHSRARAVCLPRTADRRARRPRAPM